MMAVYLVSGDKRGFGAAVFSTGGNLGFALGPVVAACWCWDSACTPRWAWSRWA